jgi:hypothetical protein
MVHRWLRQDTRTLGSGGDSSSVQVTKRVAEFVPLQLPPGAVADMASDIPLCQYDMLHLAPRNQ